MYFGRCWLQDGVFGSILSDVAGSWRQDGEQKHPGEAFGRKLGGWLEALGEPGGAPVQGGCSAFWLGASRRISLQIGGSDTGGFNK